MRILIFGAGVVGSNLAHIFCKAGKDVTILARGERYSFLKENGLVIRHKFAGKKTDRLKVVDRLGKDDRYDVVFVCVQSTQIESVFPILAENVSETMVFVGNNMDAKGVQKALPQKHVLFAFLNAAGERKGQIVTGISPSGMTIGRTDGRDEDDAFIRSLFAGVRAKLSVNNGMDDWLKAHAAFIMPIVLACYHTGMQLKELKYEESYMGLMADATKETYVALMALGYHVPEEKVDYVSVKKRKCIGFYKKLSRFPSHADIAVAAHARNAKAEMSHILAEICRLIVRSGIAMPAMEELLLLDGDSLGVGIDTDVPKEKARPVVAQG